MIAEFAITVMDDADFKRLSDSMKTEYDIKLDDMLVVEGCLNDDKTVLGGRDAFMSHFCTFYQFNVCYSAAESKGVRKIDNSLNDTEFVGKKID